MLFWALSFRRNYFHKKELRKNKKSKTPKSFKNFKTSFSSPPKKETSSFARPWITGALQLNALPHSSPKNLTNNRSKFASFCGETITSILGPNNFHSNRETKMTDQFVWIGFLSRFGTFSKTFNPKTNKKYKRSSPPLALKYLKTPKKITITFSSDKSSMLGCLSISSRWKESFKCYLTLSVHKTSGFPTFWDFKTRRPEYPKKSRRPYQHVHSIKMNR